jgi:hypothetical protein
LLSWAVSCCASLTAVSTSSKKASRSSSIVAARFCWWSNCVKVW